MGKLFNDEQLLLNEMNQASNKIISFKSFMIISLQTVNIT